ncbi:hypothetical protein NXT3_PA00284 (plasmid) [Sinorhizobium fredii]|uniref:Uncharacterized protein n=1 Tax=Rhizobium fredii TaxID=380 RepID=A0A2L0HBK6_RHIFR|nr:hypothetical protein NXT3_PA00284 [Sinorhizobium fredii]
MGILRGGGSETFGPNERHEQVGRERKGDGEADEGFQHRTLLEPAERARVYRKHDKTADAGDNEKGVGHGHSPIVSVIRMMPPPRVKYRLGSLSGRVRK